MGRTLENKQAIVAELKESLSQSQLAVVIDYKGLTVAEITDLRRRLRPSGAECKVTKNTLMRLAVQDDPNWQPIAEICKESSAFMLLRDDLGGALKAYQDFQKATKKTLIVRGGAMEGRLLSEDDVKAIADLPSKEQLMAQIAGAINGVASKLAISINEVPSSIARALQAYVDKDDAGDNADAA
ncbi:MAG: 50S ribosomal protein L10 [Pegethrix bostrychoides GSE-TBD4-15B]|jgi:large subunit ribosomal protein L10|uniref:Large ribosomal subunit protein uL10 n=1 Tax=Pegethrix bostrychoides GSE-TBD4-15B TaxID=2839662 RepID=A0A951P9R0_9CYAN|nr:50S ribosomal protein L10 [Pegethrix bostrychoides GSE-TBD4-15B]